MEGRSERHLLTAEEFFYEPPDGQRSELIAGEVVREPPPGFEHGLLAANVAHRLRSFASVRRLGRVVVESGFVLRRDPDTVRGPDVSFVAEGRGAAIRDRLRYFEGAPDLAVEIASPGDGRRALAAKARDYFRAGARLVWIVWPASRTVDVHHPGSPPATLGTADTLDGGDVLPGFELPVGRIFED